jgi:hypothetical protein
MRLSFLVFSKDIAKLVMESNNMDAMPKNLNKSFELLYRLLRVNEYQIFNQKQVLRVPVMAPAGSESTMPSGFKVTWLIPHLNVPLVVRYQVFYCNTMLYGKQTDTVCIA